MNDPLKGLQAVALQMGIQGGLGAARAVAYQNIENDGLRNKISDIISLAQGGFAFAQGNVISGTMMILRPAVKTAADLLDSGHYFHGSDMTYWIRESADAVGITGTGMYLGGIESAGINSPGIYIGPGIKMLAGAVPLGVAYGFSVYKAIKNRDGPKLILRLGVPMAIAAASMIYTQNAQAQDPVTDFTSLNVDRVSIYGNDNCFAVLNYDDLHDQNGEPYEMCTIDQSGKIVAQPRSIDRASVISTLYSMGGDYQKIAINMASNPNIQLHHMVPENGLIEAGYDPGLYVCVSDEVHGQAGYTFSDWHPKGYGGYEIANEVCSACVSEDRGTLSFDGTFWRIDYDNNFKDCMDEVLERHWRPAIEDYQKRKQASDNPDTINIDVPEIPQANFMPCVYGLAGIAAIALLGIGGKLKGAY
jgi:hypothetical protein